MKCLFSLCVWVCLAVAAARAFNVDIWDHDGNLLTATKFSITNETGSGEGWEDSEWDYESGDDGSQGFLWGEEDEEPEHAWQFDELIRKYNHMEHIYPHLVAVPLNFPTRAGLAQTSPQDRIYPIAGDSFVLSFPYCSRYQTSFSPLADTDFSPKHISFVPTPHNQSLTLTLTHLNSSRPVYLMVYVACMDMTIRGQILQLFDPEITYVLAIRPNFHNLTWYVKTDAVPGGPHEFHPYLNTTYEADTSYWFSPSMIWLPIDIPLGLPDQPIPFRESHSLNITMTHCPEMVNLLHPFKPYRAPDGRLQILPTGRNDSAYFGFFDITPGTGAVYMTTCLNATEAQRNRYMVFRPNFRDQSFSASSPPFYDLPVTVYPNLILWRHPSWAFVHTTRDAQVFPIERLSTFTLATVSLSAGLSGWKVQFTPDFDSHVVLNLTRGANRLPDGGLAILNVSYDGHFLCFTLLNITDSDFGAYRITVIYNNGTRRTEFEQRLVYVRPHLRPSFFNPDVRAPYERRFTMPWDRRDPEHRAMALQAALEGLSPQTPTSEGAAPGQPGFHFFLVICAIAIIGLSAIVMVLAMRYVRPIVVHTYENPRPTPIELEEAQWLNGRHSRPWENLDDLSDTCSSSSSPTLPETSV